MAERLKLVSYLSLQVFNTKEIEYFLQRTLSLSLPSPLPPLREWLVCGLSVELLGESYAVQAMGESIDSVYFDKNIKFLRGQGLVSEELGPCTHHWVC